MGSGCATCKALHAAMQEAVRSLGMNECVIYDTDIQHAVEMGILRLPAVVIDGRIAAQGRKFSVRDAQELIKSHLPKVNI